jgi:hypothetical protein
MIGKIEGGKGSLHASISFYIRRGRVIRTYFSKSTRAQLKRDAPSFTVEIRQHKRRPPSESPNTSWVDAKLAPVSNGQEPHRIAAAAFKTIDASAPVAVVSAPSARSGRILPSLETSLPVDVELAEDLEPPTKPRLTRKRRVASPVRSIDVNDVSRPVWEDRAPISPPRGEARAHAIAEPRRDAAAVRPVNALSKLRAKLGAAEKRARTTLREAQSNPAPVAAVHAPPARVEEAEQGPASGRSKRPILARYVLRGEGEPGQSWKRKLLARRENRT